MVIVWNGKIITGWRAWLIAIVGFVVAVVVFWLVAFLMLGLATSLGAIMLVVVAAAAVVGFAAWIFGKVPYGP